MAAQVLLETVICAVPIVTGVTLLLWASQRLRMASKAGRSPMVSQGPQPALAVNTPVAAAPVAAARLSHTKTATAGTAKADPAAQPLTANEVFGKLAELALGRAHPELPHPEIHQQVADSVASSLEIVAVQERYAPRRPNMLPRILNASADDSFSRRQLAALIARDPSLVGNLLKIANSSYYRVTPEPVESVDRALVLLGTDGIRSLVTAALVQPIFRIGGADFPRYPEIAWEHAFRAASASVAHNFVSEQSEPFAAELLSLVLGLAGIVVFRVTLEEYAKHPRLRPDAGVLAAVLDTHSARVAQRIGATWELSPGTLSGLEGQSIHTSSYPTALGRSVYFGRVVGALAVLRSKSILDEQTAKASIPDDGMPEFQVERMWTRLGSDADRY